MVERLLGGGGERVVGEHKLNVVHREEILVLPHERVLGLGQHFDKPVLVKRVQACDHRQPAHEFGDKAVLHKVVRVDIVQRAFLFVVAVLADHRRALEPDCALVFEDAPLDYLVHSLKRAAAYEQHIVGFDLQEVLVRMLAPALGRHVRRAALYDFQQRLLHALARHIARNGGVGGALAGYLVYFVYVDDALLGALHIVVRRLYEAQQDVFHILAHIARLSERGGVGYGKRHVQDARERLGDVRLAGAGGAER